MAVKLSVADVIDKNKIASENAWLILLKVEIRDELGFVIETLYLVKNDENIEYQGQLYTAVEFSFDFDKAANEEGSFKLNAWDVTGVLREKMEDYNGGVGSSVTITVINSGNKEAPPELEETFDVNAATAPDINVEWTLGAENPLKYAFPPREQYRDRCQWHYRGIRCKYSGDLPSCDFTKDGPNGCKAHGNLKNFGGFIGLMNNSA